MIVKFHSREGAFLMRQEIAVPLLRLMGMTGEVPGALLAQDIPRALERLKKGLEDMKPPKPKTGDGDRAEENVGLAVRAYPLIQLLEASAKRGSDVLWEQEGRTAT